MRIFTSSAPSLDKFAWLPDKSRAYNTRSGYSVGILASIENLTSQQPINWMKNVWNIKTAPKLKDFIWRLTRKAVPVSENLATRGIDSFPCKTCNGVEDDLHVFLICPLAEQVWEIVPLETRPSMMTASIYEFLSSLLPSRNLPPSGVIIPLWPWILWNL